MPQNPPDHRRLFGALAEYDVEYIVVGGVAAALRGSPVATFDVDIVPSLASENISRLLQALEELNAVFRSHPELRPTRSHLESRGHKLLRTPFGDLDVLGAIGHDEDFERLSADANTMTVAGQRVHVLGIESLIRTKKAAGRPKDAYGVMHLERLLAEQG